MDLSVGHQSFSFLPQQSETKKLKSEILVVCQMIKTNFITYCKQTFIRSDFISRSTADKLVRNDLYSWPNLYGRVITNIQQGLVCVISDEEAPANCTKNFWHVNKSWFTVLVLCIKRNDIWLGKSLYCVFQAHLPKHSSLLTYFLGQRPRI